MEGHTLNQEPGSRAQTAGRYSKSREEVPAYLYLTEVSHSYGDKMYAYGGGTAFPGGGYGIFPRRIALGWRHRAEHVCIRWIEFE